MFGKPNEFVFWSQAQVRDECQHLGDATCSKMNEALFSKYSEIEKKALEQVVGFTESEIKKKQEKEQKLKQFVEQADDLLVPDHDQSLIPNSTVDTPSSVFATATQAPVEEKNKTTLATLDSEVCEYLSDY